MKDLSNADVTVTMKGGEWFALLAAAAGKPLSGIGRELKNSAGRKLADAMTAASDALPEVCGKSINGTMMGCTRDLGHEGACRCSAVDVDARKRKTEDA